jgi:hypothetical protein
VCSDVHKTQVDVWHNCSERRANHNFSQLVAHENSLLCIRRKTKCCIAPNTHHYTCCGRRTRRCLRKHTVFLAKSSILLRKQSESHQQADQTLSQSVSLPRAEFAKMSDKLTRYVYSPQTNPDSIYCFFPPRNSANIKSSHSIAIISTDKVCRYPQLPHYPANDVFKMLT